MAHDKAFVERFLREPLLHFLVIGTLILAYFSLTSAPDPTDGDNRIVVSATEVEQMAMAWTKRWLRPPTDLELDGMIREAVRERVLYREAVALGLDRDDVVIRRHLRQKYEFVTQDLAYDADPDEATLRAYYHTRADRYTQAARLSFSHILFSRDRRGSSAEADAQQTLADLQWATGPQAAETLGDATSLAPSFEALGEFEVTAMFGPDFASALLHLEPGRWAGPVASSYGLHLVWLSERVSGERLKFEDVKQSVKDDWVYDQRTGANEAIFRKLLERYEVIVEPSAPQTEAGGGDS